MSDKRTLAKGGRAVKSDRYKTGILALLDKYSKILDERERDYIRRFYAHGVSLQVFARENDFRAQSAAAKRDKGEFKLLKRWLSEGGGDVD